MAFGASEFWTHFVPAFVEATKTEGSTAWLYYQKQKIRSDIKDSDWTPMIITFLDGFAWARGLIQLYERAPPGSKDGKRDCVWFRGNGSDRLVVIEPENQPRYVIFSEVPKLLKDDAPLKVLITYHAYAKAEAPEAWRRKFLDTLRHEVTGEGHPVRPSGPVEFLTILGDRVEEDPTDWHGFVLKRSDRDWQDDWMALPRD